MGAILVTMKALTPFLLTLFLAPSIFCFYKFPGTDGPVANAIWKNGINVLDPSNLKIGAQMPWPFASTTASPTTTQPAKHHWYDDDAKIAATVIGINIAIILIMAPLLVMFYRKHQPLD